MSPPSRPRFRPEVVRFEPRALLSITTSTAFVKVDYDAFVSQLRTIELHSQATPAEFLALRDDARSISAAASVGNLTAQDAQNKVLAATLQIDRAPLDGWLNEAGWSQVSDRLNANLLPLGVPQSLIDTTLTDMKAIASSVGLNAAAYNSLNKHWNKLHQDLEFYRSYTSYPEPAVYYTEHLRGFFRGWTVQRLADAAQLTADQRSLSAPGGLATVQRNTKLLESLGGQVTSSSSASLMDAYAAAFASGAPTPADLDGLRSAINAALGPAVAARRVSTVNQLLSGATSLFAALGSSPANVKTIAGDTQNVVEDGGGGTGLNPFRIQILARPG